LLNRLHEQYRKAGFTLLGVNIDDRPDVARTMARSLGISFPVLFDSEKQVSRLYDVNAMPSTVLIDRTARCATSTLVIVLVMKPNMSRRSGELLKQ